MINNFIKQVSEFHDAFGVKRGNVDIQLRYDLLKEEFEEYKASKDLVEKADAICDMLYIACGTIDLHNWAPIKKHTPNNQYENITLCLINASLKRYLIYRKKYFISNVINEVLTLAYNNNIYDILPELFAEVHASNMSKLDDNGKPIINGQNGFLDESKPLNKILKSSNFREPNLKDILIKNGKI